MNTLVIYHGNCADGFGAGWVCNRFFAGGADFHAGIYQQPPPSVDGRDVVMVDFSYKRETLLEIADRANSVVILDHHKTAAEDLQSLPGNVKCVFDMERSGAMIAWDYYYPGLRAPRLLHHIQDRDLWRFALPLTREIQATVFSHPYDFLVWDELMRCDLRVLAAEGAAIERKHQKDVAELVKAFRRRMVIGGAEVWVANLPYTLTSDAGHLMCEEGEPFAACYWDTPEGRVFSLRSREGGADVAEIAKAYGGGGHKHASGFRLPHGVAP